METLYIMFKSSLLTLKEEFNYESHSRANL